MLGFMEDGEVIEDLRWLIQSPSGTGLRTGFDGMWFRPFWPVEDVRGGMALGERRFSDTILEGPRWERLLWNIRVNMSVGCSEWEL